MVVAAKRRHRNQDQRHGGEQFFVAGKLFGKQHIDPCSDHKDQKYRHPLKHTLIRIIFYIENAQPVPPAEQYQYPAEEDHFPEQQDHPETPPRPADQNGKQTACPRQHNHMDQPLRAELIIQKHCQHHGYSRVIRCLRRHLHQSNDPRRILRQAIPRRNRQ